MTSIFRKQWMKLRDKAYREHLVAAEVKRSIPFQMRAMLKQRKWTQEQLAEASGLTQGALSRALNPNYGNLTLNTIIRVAAGFDVAFVGMFVPFSKLADLDGLTEERVIPVPSFIEEDAKSGVGSSQAPEVAGRSIEDVQFRTVKATIRRVKSSSTDSNSVRNEGAYALVEARHANV